MAKRTAAAKTAAPSKTDNPDFVPESRAAGPRITKIEGVYFASILLTLSTGEQLQLIAGGKGSNQQNAEVRDRLVTILKEQLS